MDAFFSREHAPLIIALALPIVFIGGVLLFTLPTRHVATIYSVLVARCPQQNGYWRPCAIGADAMYVAKDGKVTVQKPNLPAVAAGEKPVEFATPVLTIYTHTTKSARLVRDVDVAQIALVGTDAAPDGTRIEYRYGRGGDFLFFGGSSNGGWYLVNGKNAEKIDPSTLGIEPYAGTDRIEVVGWIQE